MKIKCHQSTNKLFSITGRNGWRRVRFIPAEVWPVSLHRRALLQLRRQKLLHTSFGCKVDEVKLAIFPQIQHQAPKNYR